MIYDKFNLIYITKLYMSSINLIIYLLCYYFKFCLFIIILDNILNYRFMTFITHNVQNKLNYKKITFLIL